MSAPATAGQAAAGSFRRFVDDWNRSQELETPVLHRQIADWLEVAWRRERRQLALQVFRDGGKSTLVGLFCAWLLSRWPDLRIMVLAADHDLARRMVRNVRQIIEHHPDAEPIRPGRASGEWAADRFTVRREAALRDPSMSAKGLTANITGGRADVVVCDDVEVPNTAGTADKRRQLRERLGEVEFVLVPGGTQLFIGTPHAWASIYAREARREEGEEKPFLDGFDRLDIPAHDRHGRAAWPERYPADHLAHMRRRTGAHSFASQMLLQQTDPRGVRLDPARLKPYDGGLEYYTANGHQVLEIDGRRMARGVAWWDPAMGRPDRGDASVVAAVYADDAGGYWLHRIAYLTIDPERLDRESEIDQLCRQVGAFLDGLYLPKLLVEKNGLGAFLPGHLRNALAAVRIGTRVEEAHSRTAKAQRILDAFDPVLGAGALHVQRAVWDTPFIAEMRDWQAEGNPADDGLDAVAGCLLAGPVRLPVAAPPAMPDWRPGAGTFIANTNFAV